MAFPHSAWSFIAVLASCLAGALAASAWAIVASAAALVIAAALQHQAHYTRYAASANFTAQSMLLAGSSLIALIAAAAAFGAGRATVLVWGL